MSRCDKRCAECCEDQLPAIATFGRGPKGDSSHVEVGEPDTKSETYIKGWRIDEVTGEIIVDSEWITENINGGHLSYHYNLNPFTVPRTFTITFVYDRPGRPEWSWTTPAIPYIWTVDSDGNPIESAKDIVGSGVANFWLKRMTDKDWKEMLIFPEGTDGSKFNAPGVGEAWTVNLDLNDLEIPDLDSIAKIIGVTKDSLIALLNNPIPTDTMNGLNVKQYIDSKISKIENKLNFILNRIAGVKTDPDDNPVWDDGVGEDFMIPVGNINILSSSENNAILTHVGNSKTGDLKAN